MFLPILLLIIGVITLLVPIPLQNFKPLKKFVAIAFFASSGLVTVSSAVAYNDAGYCVHVRTAFGQEHSKCDIGWYFSGWGNTTSWPHYITIAHTNATDADGSSISSPYAIRMADNWAGSVTETTRFGIPKDEPQFLKMARDFRSPERLITSTLRPAVTASMDSVANLYTMEEYYAGGKRDEFKTDFQETVEKGRAVIEREEVVVSNASIDRNVTPSDSDAVADTAQTGGDETVRYVSRKVTDAAGNIIRIPHGFAEYGIIVSTAILQNLDPDDVFEELIKDRKNAAARRTVAREQRLEQEEQRLLTISKAERDIAERQGQARVDQIQRTTDAETEKKLALVSSEREREQARVAKETAALNLDRAKIDAESKQVTADAEAYEKRAILEADNALQAKLNAYVKVQEYWADAFARRQVPSTVFGGGEGSTLPGGDGDVANFLKLKTVEAARDLNLDPGIKQSN